MTRIRTTVTGIVGTKPTLLIRSTANGELRVAQFRLAVVDRYRDYATQEWRDGETQWVTVCAFRDLADNICESFDKGQRVMVEGVIKVNEYLTADNQPRVELRLEAKAAGHDLTFGRSRYTRTIRESHNTADAGAHETAAGESTPSVQASEPAADAATGEIVPDHAQRETIATTSDTGIDFTAPAPEVTAKAGRTKKGAPTSVDELVSAPF